MVALTVVLAAVVGAYVMGFQDQLTEPAPSNTIESDTTEMDGENELLISHEGGDAVHWDDVRVAIDGETSDAAVDATGEFAVGDTAVTAEELDDDQVFDVQIVHEPSQTIIASATVET